MNDSIINEALQILEERGGGRYGGEAVTQKEHALQAAWAAERAGADSELIAAALLHDIGHLMYEAGEDEPAASGHNDAHEEAGAAWLMLHFGPAVVEPIRLHVDAKRYLCTAEAGYFERLSPSSVRSLGLQGGPFTDGEAAAFRGHPNFAAAVRLRHWDEEAKVPKLQTPGLSHFRPHLEAARSQFLNRG